jgi:CelD/BcsL family acetyltransferase involved in cellulose biosynthesis
MRLGLLVEDVCRDASPHRGGAAASDAGAEQAPRADDTIDVVETADGLAALEPQWTALQARAGRPHQVFQSHAFATTWLRSATGEGEGSPGRRVATPRLAIVTVWRDGRLLLVLPLVVTRWLGLTALRWLGEPVLQYGDALVDDVPDAVAVMQAALEHVRRVLEPDVLQLGMVRSDAAIAPLLARLGTIETGRDEAPWVQLGPGEGTRSFEDRQSGKSKKNRRRLMRRLQERGTVRFVVASGEAARPLVSVAIEQKRTWLQHKGLVSLGLGKGRLQRFMTAAASEAGEPTGLSAFALMLDEAPVAIALGFLGERRLTLHLISYAMAHEKSGAGVLNLEAILRYAEAAGLEAVDLLAPSADYKLDWADATVTVTDQVLAKGPLARACAIGFETVLVPRAKAAYAALPLGLRRRLGACVNGRRAIAGTMPARCGRPAGASVQD